MARQFLGPRKKRTREHIIADQSVHYVEGFVLDAGHTAQRIERDYGYDLVVFTYDEVGYIEPDFLLIQVKAAQKLQRVGSDHVFDLDIRDYNLWMREETPVILILYDAFRRRAYWLHVQRYFRHSEARRPNEHARTVRVRVPTRQILNGRAIAEMRELKRKPQLRLIRELS